MWAVRNFTLMGCGCDWVGVAGGMNKHLSTRVCVRVCVCFCVFLCSAPVCTWAKRPENKLRKKYCLDQEGSVLCSCELSMWL